MKIVSVINYKGGVGKTTITTNLAYELALKNKRVLVLDLDPQTSTTQSLIPISPIANYQNYQLQIQNNEIYTIRSYFENCLNTNFNPQLMLKLPIINVIHTSNGFLDFVPSDFNLTYINNLLTIYLSHSFKPIDSIINYLNLYERLKLDLNDYNMNYDVILLDCPPNFDIITKMAISASDSYIIPTKMNEMSIVGIQTLISHIDTHINEYSQYLNLCGLYYKRPINSINAPICLGVIANMLNIKGIAVENNIINNLINLGIPLFNIRLRENVSMYGSSIIPLTARKNNYYRSKDTYDEVLKELEDLTDEFIIKAGI